ncbi:TIR domain-containing protein [Actinomadura syzygii]|uniref:TIR domain-containing protein n=1 Tax=Actinomadura syzygii TaxID=1427538 RepID=UPI0016528CE9|nr:TIR domain-containing protein [Actinomadura syzygii]
MHVLELSNEDAGAFRVRLLRRGEPYGLFHRLTYDKDEALLEFYPPAVDGQPLSEAGLTSTSRASSFRQARDEWFKVPGGPRISPENSRELAAWLEGELSKPWTPPPPPDRPPLPSQARSRAGAELHQTGDRRVTFYVGGVLGYVRKEAQWLEVNRLSDGRHVIDCLLRGRRRIRRLVLEPGSPLVVVLGWDHSDLQPGRQPVEYSFPWGQQTLKATLTGPKYVAGDPRFEQDFESELDAYLTSLPLAQVLLDLRGERASAPSEQLILNRHGIRGPADSSGQSPTAVFVSYYHGGNAAARERFEREYGTVIRSSSIYPGEINTGPEVRREIRKRIAGCDFLVVLVGRETYTRRWVDWEMHAALTRTRGTAKPVVGILLPEMADTGAFLVPRLEPVLSRRSVTEVLRRSDELSQELLAETGTTLPARLLDNLLTGYATLIAWPASSEALIEALATSTGRTRPVTKRPLFTRNLGPAMDKDPQKEPAPQDAPTVVEDATADDATADDATPRRPSAEPPSLERLLARLGRVRHFGAPKVVAGPDGTWLATASEGLVELWDQATRTRLHVFDGMWGDIEGLAVSPRGDWIAAVDGIHMVRLWSVPSYELLLERWAGQWGAGAVATDPEGRRLVVGGSDVQIWDIPSGERLQVLKPPGRGTEALFYGPNGQWLGCVGGSHATVRIWPIPGAETKLDLTNRVKNAWIGYLVVDPAGRWLATAGGSAVQVWDLVTGKRLQSLTPPGGSLKDLIVGPEAQWLACTGGDETAVRIWPGQTTRPAEHIDRPPQQTGHWTTTGTRGTVQIWSPGPGSPGGLD